MFLVFYQFLLSLAIGSCIVLTSSCNYCSGKIVRDSEFFQDGKYIWPEGYTAVRKFTSIKGNIIIYHQHSWSFYFEAA